MKKKKRNSSLPLITASVVLIVVCVLLIVLAVKIISVSSGKDRKKADAINEQTENGTSLESVDANQGDLSEGQSEKESQSDGSENNSGTMADGSQGSMGSVSNPIAAPNVIIDLTGGDENTNQGSFGSVSLPYQMDSGLTVTKIAGYDGVFIEDGSDTDISGVAAMAVTNNGSSNVEYAEITVVQGDRNLLFKVSALPAGATVVAMEVNKASYEEGDYSSITANVAGLDKFEMSEDQIRIKDNGDNTLTVTNISGQDISCVRLFYKYCMEDDIYVGGIAYMVKLTDLQAGQSKTVSPSHFVSGSSEVMMVRTYDTAE